MIRAVVDFALNKRLLVVAGALSHEIGSDSQRPFTIVIVGGLIADLLMNIFLLPTFYVWWARPTDHLPKPEEAKSVYE
jgi:cobalt-zinc-cadmium resistance protein CzcA